MINGQRLPNYLYWEDLNNRVRKHMSKKFLKGMCYEPFPLGYNPSTANDSCIFFGSDIAAYNIKPLWGDSFSPVGGPDAGKIYTGRNDIKNLAELGVNLIRLYDWDSRNDHIPFLDYCEQYAIKVLVPVSNYNLGAFGAPPDMQASITGLINSFSKNGDYHPAVHGVIIGSETDQIANVSPSYLIEYTKKWAEIESIGYKSYRKVLIGHPISFAMSGPGWSGDYPCFGYLDEIIPPLLKESLRSLNQRLIICPHTYNEASYLYKDAQGSGRGWVDLVYDRYNLPILFCEIGCSRLTRTDYLEVITAQLIESAQYYSNNSEKLLGISYFQYCDKVWTPDTTEGSFGIVANTEEVTDVVHYGEKDFTHWVGVACINDSLNIQILKEQPANKIVKEVYLI